MKLIDVIYHLKTINEAEIFIKKELPDVELEQVDTYLKDVLDVNSDIRFF